MGGESEWFRSVVSSKSQQFNKKKRKYAIYREYWRIFLDGLTSSWFEQRSREECWWKRWSLHGHGFARSPTAGHTELCSGLCIPPVSPSPWPLKTANFKSILLFFQLSADQIHKWSFIKHCGIIARRLGTHCDTRALLHAATSIYYSYLRSMQNTIPIFMTSYKRAAVSPNSTNRARSVPSVTPKAQRRELQSTLSILNIYELYSRKAVL